MRWLEHIYWTRFVVQDIVFSNPNTDADVQRLLRNPVDFANILRPFYGNAIAMRFKDLFTRHLTIAAELVKAEKAGDNAKADLERKKWYQNATEIAEFLSKINPFWNRAKWQEMLFTHLRLTETEAGQLLADKYAASIATFEAIQTEAFMMSDYMFEGIVRQFKL
ncbi:MAG: acetylglutamate kinase [Clostridiales bacterium]|nr:acetylglutamate kinase [Clostridiales bacterium]